MLGTIIGVIIVASLVHALSKPVYKPPKLQYKKEVLLEDDYTKQKALEYKHNLDVSMGRVPATPYIPTRKEINTAIDQLCGASETEYVYPLKRVPVTPSPVEQYIHPVWFISDWARTLPPSPAEQMIITSLSRYDIEWHREVSFSGCILPHSTSSLPYARFDFWLPSINTIIEYHGEQYHNTPDKIKNDQFKRQYLQDNLIRLVVWNKRDYYHIDRRVDELLQKFLN